MKDYIENTDPKAGILSHQFKLDDNNFLNDRYKESIKASTPSGMFYERNINGMWVSGDGVVYADFDLNENTIKADELDDIPIKRILCWCRLGLRALWIYCVNRTRYRW